MEKISANYWIHLPLDSYISRLWIFLYQHIESQVINYIWNDKFTAFLQPTEGIISSQFFFSCDADPAALAKYVVALVKKDKPVEELRDICVDQLEVFLSSGNILITK